MISACTVQKFKTKSVDNTSLCAYMYICDQYIKQFGLNLTSEADRPNAFSQYVYPNEGHPRNSLGIEPGTILQKVWIFQTESDSETQ